MEPELNQRGSVSRRMIMMNPLKRFGCLWGQHRRSRGQAFEDGDGRLRSSCRHCGISMIKDSSGRWGLAGL
jgi:hypothetical protein